MGDGNYIEYGVGMIFDDPMFCDEVGIDAFSPLVGAGFDGMIWGILLTYFEPKITGIMDIPDDQGGRVYLDFIRSPFDNDGDINQLYTIFQLDIIDSDSIWGCSLRRYHW